MFDIDKDKVFYMSKKKVLIREFNNLKSDYSKYNVLKYKSLYVNASLSFILENSQYIFTEPMMGCEFYKNVITSYAIPFHLMESECDKVSDYIEKHMNDMSDCQKELYFDLKNAVDNRYENMKNSIHLYVSIMENADSVIKYYDALYDYMKNPEQKHIDVLAEIITDSDSINLMDSINLLSYVPELHSNLLEYIKSSYVEKPSVPDDYELNSYTSNVIGRMLKDPYIKELVGSISNVNLRHTIIGLSEIDDIDAIIELTTEYAEYVSNDQIDVTDIINNIYEDVASQPLVQEYDDEEKAMRLLCQKSVVDTNLAFTLVDAYYNDETHGNRIIEKICINNDNVTSIPRDIVEHTKLLQEMSDNLKCEIISICEKYFTPGGGPSAVVARSIGMNGKDTRMTNQKGEKYDTYTPHQMSNDSNDEDTDDNDVKHDNDSEKDASDERNDKKDKKMNKYANMKLDDVDLTEFFLSDEMLSYDYIKEKKEKEEKKDDHLIPELIPPQKKNIFQRIQNKAIDRNVKFKKKVANSSRRAVDARNAAKATASIPKSITSSIRKTVDDWDEMDDNRRKEYMIKPGFRKKYFKALKLCIVHYGAFSINPVLNIVLFICRRGSKSKDERIKNELIRELKAEIHVTEEKIEDAKSNGDNKQKYQLMRIKEKLTAEVVRIEANTKYV